MTDETPEKSETEIVFDPDLSDGGKLIDESMLDNLLSPSHEDEVSD